MFGACRNSTAEVEETFRRWSKLVEASDLRPEWHKSAFGCPYCGVFAEQSWSPVRTTSKDGSLENINGMDVSRCGHCGRIAVWHEHTMVLPKYGSSITPHPALPVEIRQDFEEARSILALSPRGAAALLRLAIQKLCKVLGESGENLNDDIASLVKKGLPSKLQQALDVVRVIGNEAVHPGTIDLRDNIETAESLLALVNIIADCMIDQPGRIQRLFDSLPDEKRKAIQDRDKVRSD